LFHYPEQREIRALTLGAPNWYQLLPSAIPGFYEVGVILTLVSVLLFMLAMYRRKENGPSFQWLIVTSTLSVLFVPFLLPRMHERYFFAADVFSVIFAFSFYKGWRIACIIQFASLFSYFRYLFDIEPIPKKCLAVMMAVAIGMLLNYFRRPQAIFNKFPVCVRHSDV